MNVRQAGTALITALFIMALVVIAATAMSLRLQIDIRRTQSVLNTDKLYFVAQGVTFWGIGLLKSDVKNAKDPNTILDPLPQQFSPTDYNGITVRGSIEDQQALFNLNNLIDQRYLPVFIRLLKTLNPEISDEQAQNIAQNIALQAAGVSVDRNGMVSNQNSGQLLQNSSVIMTTPGMTAEIYQHLAPYITALPDITPINVNHASAPLLMSLANNFPLDLANKIISQRKSSNGFQSLNDFTSIPEVTKLNITADFITVTSQYFTTKAEASLGDQDLVLTDSIKRKMINNQVQVNIIQEMKG